VTCQQFGHTRRLGSRKAQPVMPVAPQEPPDRSVAEAAMAIEDDQQPPAELDSIRHPHIG
jgi:hypothetical protein